MDQGNQGAHGNDNYKTPVQNASIGNVKGAEYSYLAYDKLMVLVSYGIRADYGNVNSNAQSSSFDDDYQLISGLRYSTDSGYKIGLIYNLYQKNGIKNSSILLPIEKRFNEFHLMSTLVYKDKTEQEQQYYGLENALIYSINDSNYLRGVVNLDQQDSNNNYGLSLTYTKMYKSVLLNLTGARKTTEQENENLFLVSVSLLF